MSFSELIKNLRLDFSGLPETRVAIIADYPTQHLAQAVRAVGWSAGLDLAVYQADHGHPDIEIANPASGLYAFKPDFVLLGYGLRKLWLTFESLASSDKSTFAEQYINALSGAINTITQNSRARVLLCNFPETPDPVFGHYANKTPESFLWQLRHINTACMRLAKDTHQLFIVDLAARVYLAGHTAVFDPRFYAAAGMEFALDFLPCLATDAVSVIAACLGKIRKCLILDLDDTIWGGTVGDDGADNLEIGDTGLGKSFTAIQRWAKSLKERGVLLAVCSNNEEETAREPFRKRREMVLALDDFAVFIANRGSKVENIKTIQQTLDIGMDSLVFVDDNPFERNLVRSLLPEVLVPELPADPAEFFDSLSALNLFETAVISATDFKRTDQYRAAAVRRELRGNFADEEEFLESLGMRGNALPFTSATIKRIVQLIQRSNQFNLRTVRHDESAVTGFTASPLHATLAFTLADSHGDYGLIGIIILEKRYDDAFIDSWLMSCRVLKRTMENYMLNNAVNTARALGCRRLVGEYIPTAKNALVKNLYASLGFAPDGGLWSLEMAGFTPGRTYVHDHAQ